MRSNPFKRHKILFILIFFVFWGSCKSGPKVEEFLIGSWRAYKLKVHSILTFYNNGSWAIENRVEGKLSKIVAKKGRISGEWFYTDDVIAILPEDYQPPEEIEDEKSDEKKAEEDSDTPKIFLVLNVIKNEDEDEYWVEGKPNIFELVTLDKNQLIIEDLNGKVLTWDRVRAERERDVNMEGSLAIDMGSIIVNLSRTKIRQKRRYLCLDMDIVIEVPVVEGAPAIEPPPLHPRLREAAIFYLSSLTYKDIKSIDRVQEHIALLKDILNPYVKGKIQELYIKNVVVTSQKKNVEDFINNIIKPQDIEEEQPGDEEEDSEESVES